MVRSSVNRPSTAERYDSQLPKDFTRLSGEEYDKLLKQAVYVSGPSKRYGEIPGPPDDSRTSRMGNKLTRTVVRKMEVPVVTSKKVPVERDVVQKGSEKRIVKGTKMVARTGHKVVTDVKVEVQEEVVHGYRTVWKPVKEPCTHIIKRPVRKEVQRKVPYTYYEPEEVTYEMVVPKETVQKQKGYRRDKVVVGKDVLVEQDELYEMRPHHVGYGPPRVKQTDHYRELARTTDGREVYTSRPSSARTYTSSPAWSERSYRPSTSRLSNSNADLAIETLDSYNQQQATKPRTFRQVQRQRRADEHSNAKHRSSSSASQQSEFSWTGVAK